GDRLLGVVELQDQVESRESLSPELRAAAMATVASQAKGRNFEKALPNARHRGWSLAVLTAFAVAGASLVLVPKAGINALKRWLMPLADTPRYTFTKLEPYAERIVVPQGEPFSITLSLSADSDQRPASGTARYGIQEPITTTLSEDLKYRFEFPGQQDPGTVAIQIGDSRNGVEVIPTTRPTIESVSARVTYPDYLELKPRLVDLRAGSLSVVAGSKVSLEARTAESRQIEQGTLTVRDLPVVRERNLYDEFNDFDEGAEEGPSAEEEETEPPAPRVSSLRVAGDSMTSEPTEIGVVPTEMVLNWRDVLGLDN
ncbi:MAG: hypothetical protein GWO24_10845, partial [Akkermansiaceae bacterium]|nr:hypothetical protein [Akkermansiaceae bacterium]